MLAAVFIKKQTLSLRQPQHQTATRAQILLRAWQPQFSLLGGGLLILLLSRARNLALPPAGGVANSANSGQKVRGIVPSIDFSWRLPSGLLDRGLGGFHHDEHSISLLQLHVLD